MAEFILEAKQREPGQHSKLTDIRKDSRVPGVIYGLGKESLTVVIDYKDLLKVLTAAGTSNIIVIKLGDKNIKTIVREYQQDPISGKLTHVDFMAIDEKQPVTTFVPIAFIGTSSAVREQGGKLNQKTTKVKVKCLPQYLPSKIEIDVSVLTQLGQKLLIKDLDRDANITIVNNPLDPVVDVTVPKKLEIIEEVKPEVAEGEEAKEGEAGAEEGAEGKPEGEATKEGEAKEEKAEDKK